MQKNSSKQYETNNQLANAIFKPRNRLEIERIEALTLVKSHVHRTNLLKHILAMQAIMIEAATYPNDEAELAIFFLYFISAL